MKLKIILTFVLLVSSVANAQRPVWMTVCTGEDGTRHMVANIRNRGAFYTLLQVSSRKGDRIEEVRADCARWSLGLAAVPPGDDTIAGPDTVGDAVLEFVCGGK